MVASFHNPTAWHSHDSNLFKCHLTSWQTELQTSCGSRQFFKNKLLLIENKANQFPQWQTHGIYYLRAQCSYGVTWNHPLTTHPIFMIRTWMVRVALPHTCTKNRNVLDILALSQCGMQIWKVMVRLLIGREYGFLEHRVIASWHSTKWYADIICQLGKAEYEPNMFSPDHYWCIRTYVLWTYLT